MTHSGQLSGVAVAQLAAWQERAKAWPLNVTGDGHQRCQACGQSVVRRFDDEGRPFTYATETLLALVVAHLRQVHGDLDPDAPPPPPVPVGVDPDVMPDPPRPELQDGTPYSAALLTDKITDHEYFPHYLRIAADLGPDARVCEVGIDQGLSLRMWQALFPLGDVAGVDNNPRAAWPPGTTKILREQADPELPALVGPRELIVDDASHVGPLTRATFDLLWPCVTPGGYYVIEDWWSYWHYEENSMLTMAEGLLGKLSGLTEKQRGHIGPPESGQRDQPAEITFRWGMIVVRKPG